MGFSMGSRQRRKFYGIWIARRESNPYETLGKLENGMAAPRLNVMNLKVSHPSAPLVTPTISLQDLSEEFAIRIRFKP